MYWAHTLYVDYVVLTLPMRYYWEVRDLEPWAMAWLGTTAPVYVLKYTEGFKNDTHKYLICVSELTISSTSKGREVKRSRR
jgi:hypothetical protein